jgi:succinoglycan biosynthesis transport protein ExoP
MNMPRQLPVISAPEPMIMPRPYGLVGLQSTANMTNEMQLRDLWDILARRRRIVFASVLMWLIVGALVCAFATRRYMATAELQVGRESDDNLGLETDGNQEPPADPLAENITLQTQAGILQSDSLALKVIDDLRLESTQDFRPKFNPIGYLMDRLSRDGSPDPHAILEDSPRRRSHVLEVFSSNLKVEPVSGTRLIAISYLNPDPRLAAQIVNHLADSLVDYNFQIRHDATSHTAQWLAGQMSDLRKQSEDLQAKVVELQHESGVFSLGETDAAGREQTYSTVLDKLQQSTSALSQAEANRIAKEAIYQVAQTGDPEAISQLSGSTFSSVGVDTSLSLIQSMRMQEATLRGQIAEMAAKFGPAYSKLSEMRSQLDVLDGSVHAEVDRIAERAKNDYEVSQHVEDNARRIYMEQKRQADFMNDKTTEYMIARKEAEESQNLYETLFRKLKESGVLAGFQASNISLVDPARVPAKPARPKKLLLMAIALAGGLFFGVAVALIKDGLDGRVHNLVALQSELGQVPLGVLPYYTRGSRLAGTAMPRILERGAQDLQLNGIPLLTATPANESQSKSRKNGTPRNRKLYLPAVEEPHSAFVESLRALRTSVLLSRERTPPQVILITSSMPEEGKTMLSANFAAVLADQHKKVLLVDADLRNPSLHHALGVSSQTGLSELLAWTGTEQSDQTFEAAACAVVVPVAAVPRLYIVPSGSIPERPAELLSSDRMSQAIRVWRGLFDYIIIDASPILPVTDAVVLSGVVDFTLLTARYQVVEQQALLHAYSVLRLRVDSNNVGIVLNAVPKWAGGYYPAYGYPQFDDMAKA